MVIFLISNNINMWCRFWIMIEDVIFASTFEKIEKEFFQQENKMVFVAGHPRSGTTNVQKASTSIGNTISSTFFDQIFPSLIMKYPMMLIVRTLDHLFFQKIFNKEGVKGHKLGMFEESEE